MTTQTTLTGPQHLAEAETHLARAETDATAYGPGHPIVAGSVALANLHLRFAELAYQVELRGFGRDFSDRDWLDAVGWHPAEMPLTPASERTPDYDG